MDSEMIKEVMPLAEVLPTVIMIAFKDLYEAFGLGVLESKDSEFLCRWYMLFDLDRSQIKSIPCRYADNDFIRNVSECVTGGLEVTHLTLILNRASEVIVHILVLTFRIFLMLCFKAQIGEAVAS